jgi:hypothetical protein
LRKRCRRRRPTKACCRLPAARAIAGVCNAQLYDIPAMISAGRRAGSLAIPLVKELTKTVALYDAEAAARSTGAAPART